MLICKYGPRECVYCRDPHDHDQVHGDQRGLLQWKQWKRDGALRVRIKATLKLTNNKCEISKWGAKQHKRKRGVNMYSKRKRKEEELT